MASASATQRSGSPADQQPPHSAGGAAPRPFTLSSNLAASGPGRNSSVAAESGSSSMPKYRASIGVPGAGGAGQVGQGHGGGSASANWRAVSPGRASTGGVGLGAAAGGRLRPASELLGVSQAGQALNSFQSSDTEAIDRWFEDLQQYEATLEEMAAASLDANFKEELSAIEQWFRVLSEAERTAALYSLLQNATPLQTRFFITVLQQMARQDPVQAALLSPANPSQLTFESQIESKLASLGLSKSPASPAMRQFARQSLSASNGGPMPTSPAPDSLLSPDSSAAASTLASQRAKLKASARTSAPANLLLSAGNTLGEGPKSPLWSKEEVLRERSPSPRPHSTGSDSAAQQQQQPSSSASLSSSTIPATAQFLRSPALDASFDQLSPAIGGSWASMVNTPLVPMFGKGETMEPGNFGTPSLGASWNGASPNPNGGIVLDDVKKYRRSARMSGLSGGALAGMYEEPSGANGGGAGTASLGSSTAADRANSAATAQKRIQDQLQAVQHLKNMQQSAVNLGLGALSNPASPNVAAGSASTGPSSGVGGSRLTSTGALSSPGLQQTAMAAQQNWRNANAAHLPPPSPNNNAHYGNNANHLHAQHDAYGVSAGLNGLGVGTGGLSPNLGLGVGNGAPPSPNTAASVQAQAQAQLASLIALQQQMMQQQAQLQNLANLQGLNGLGMGLGNPGLGVGAIGGFGSQLSPRLGGGGVGGPGTSPSGFGGFGFGGAPNGMMHSPRRSPRPHGNDRSPNFGSSFGSHASRPGGNGANSASGGNPQQTPGSGANPDEPLDMNLLGDTPAWLRSLRLHKYTPNFEGVGWKEMVLLGDKDLEDKGVSALGARRKLLKVFETVRGKTGMALPGDGAEASSPIDSVKDDAPASPIDSNHGNSDANNGKEEEASA
ncbi:Flap-structured DNA-binding and RNA-binding protein [Rhodotorula toruloides]